MRLVPACRERDLSKCDRLIWAIVDLGSRFAQFGSGVDQVRAILIDGR